MLAAASSSSIHMPPPTLNAATRPAMGMTPMQRRAAAHLATTMAAPKAQPAAAPVMATTLSNPASLPLSPDAPASTLAEASSPPPVPTPSLGPVRLPPPPTLTPPPFRRRVTHQRATLARARRFVAKIAPLYLHPAARPAVAAFMNAYLQLRTQVEREECCCVEQDREQQQQQQQLSGASSLGLGLPCPRGLEAVIAKEAERRRTEDFQAALDRTPAFEPNICTWRDGVARWRFTWRSHSEEDTNMDVDSPPATELATPVDTKPVLHDSMVDGESAAESFKRAAATAATGEGLAHKCCECRGLGLTTTTTQQPTPPPTTPAPLAPALPAFTPPSPERERDAGEALMFLATGMRRKRIDDDASTEPTRKRVRVPPTPDASDEEDHHDSLEAPSPVIPAAPMTAMTAATAGTAATEVKVEPDRDHEREHEYEHEFDYERKPALAQSGSGAQRAPKRVHYADDGPQTEEYETDDGDEHAVLSAAFDRRASEVFFSMLRGRVVRDENGRCRVVPAGPPLMR